MFITFEGSEGAGKSTAIASVSEHLRGIGIDVVTTREPGAGDVGKAIRQILLHSETLDARAELFLFLADRSNHVATVIRPALTAGKWVLCDRYSDSTLVYQACVRGMDDHLVRTANNFATGHLVPELTFLLDIDPAVGLARLTSRDRLDQEPLEFHKRVREGFLKEAAIDPSRWRIIDAAKAPEEVVQDILSHLKDRVGERTGPVVTP